MDFKKEFLNLNFDKQLIENNSKLVNSQEYYLQYKNNYISNTKKNMAIYDDLVEKLNFVSNTSENNHYVFLDTDNLTNLEIKIQDIILRQRTLLANFNHYIETLIDSPHLFEIIEEQNKKQERTFFSKLLNNRKNKK